MNIGERLYGFEIIGKKYVRELGSDVYTMRHVGCGARLVLVDREDDNKTFSISFKTLPKDSTGVFHIIEHSVLCGSRKYPVKDPFVELLKGSLNTFLNAMTFQDKTMYPVSSRNDRDFLNLVGIYMDAVLHPLVVENPNAFYQEGWHYEVDENTGALSYKGVVLNEMRGDYSSPEAISDRHMNAMLYEGTPYAEDSGGDPECIVDLSYEEFCRAHSSFYHPSRAEIFLDGSVKLCEVLPLIDSYLAEYTDSPEWDGAEEKLSSKRTSPISKTVEYEIKEGEGTANKTRVSVGFLISRFDNPERSVSSGVLLGTLFGSNEAPVKKAMLDSGLCEDVCYTIRDGIFEHSAEVEFINVKDGKEDELLAVFRDTVSGIVKNGIDKSELLATLNSTEFRIREKDYGSLPLGVANAIICLESLLYSDDPTQNFEYEDMLAYLREKIESDYYERLLEQIILNNDRRATLIMHPSLTLAGERLERERARLCEYSDALTEEQRAELVEMNRALIEWQEGEESAENLATIPMLTIDDISKTVPKTPTEILEIEGVKVICHDIKTSGIVYADLIFDITDMDGDRLPLLSVLNLLLGNLATEKHSAIEIQRMIKTNLGGFEARLTAVSNHGEPHMYLQVSISALESAREKNAEIAEEILEKTVFNDYSAIKNIIRQTVISSEEAFAASGHQIALGRSFAMSSIEAAAREYYSGYEAYVALKEIDGKFESEREAVCARLSQMLFEIISRQRLTVSLTGCTDAEYAKRLISVIKNGEKAAPVCNISLIPKRKEGIEIPAQVSFVGFGHSLALIGEQPSGSLDVARMLVGYEFLWPRVRVRGGAYGAGMTAGLSGNIGFYSYRDPSPKKTLDCFVEIAEFLRAFVKDGRDITKYIIGAVGDAEPVKTPRTRGAFATARYLRGISYEESCEIRRSLIETDAKELLRIAELIERCVADGASCVVAGKEKLATLSGELDCVLKI
ncbi:MAG: insulinase family protein [Clostridia bacterium]|nr:insulinase family protein [Clostridia bacterium]